MFLEKKYSSPHLRVLSPPILGVEAIPTLRYFTMQPCETGQATHDTDISVHYDCFEHVSKLGKFYIK